MITWTIRRALAGFVALAVLAEMAASAQTPVPAAASLTNAPPPTEMTTAAIQALPAEEVSRYTSVQVEGVVTLSRDRARLFFIQDRTGGISCDVSRIDELPPVGTRVRARGRVTPGAYRPILQLRQIDSLGPGILPVPRPVTARQLFAGEFDGDYVQLTGHVKRVQFDSTPVGQWLVIVQSGAVEFGVRLSPTIVWPKLDARLRGALVAVTGAAGMVADERRGVQSVNVNVGQAEGFKVLADAATVAQGLPLATQEGIGSESNRVEKLTRWRGRVTAVFSNEVFLRTAAGNVCAEGTATGLQVGDEVDLAGFYRWSPRERRLRLTHVLSREAGPVAEPRRVTLEELCDAGMDGELVTFEGQFLHGVHRAGGDFLLLRGGETTVVVRRRGDVEPSLRHLMSGARVRATGVRNGSLDDVGEARTPLVDATKPVVVLTPPPWPMRRTVGVVGALAAALAAGLAALGVAHRRLRESNRRVEEAERQLRLLNADLEARIRARTVELASTNEQLHREIAERQVAQSRLAASEERFQLAMRGANDGLWDWNLVTGEIYYSPRWKSMLGYEDHELANHTDTWNRLIEPADGAATRVLVEAALAGASNTFQAEFRLRHKEGHWVTVLSRAFLVRNPDGRVVRFVGTHEDVTARRQDERALRESEERFARTFHASPAVIVITRRSDSRYIDVNACFTEVMGYTREEAVGRTALELGVWADLISRAAILEAMASGRKVRDSECVLRTKAGEHRVMLASVEEIVIAGERCLLWINHDITRRKRIESAFRALAEGPVLAPGHQFFAHMARRLADILHTRAVVIAVRAPGPSDDRVVTLGVCVGLENLPDFGRCTAGTPCGEVLREGRIHVVEKVRQRFPADEFLQQVGAESYLGLAIQNSRRERIGLIAVAHGTVLPASPELEPILRLFADSAGAEIERRAAERARAGLELQLQQAQKMEAIGTLAGGIAHDFNNILGSIIGYGELARRDARGHPGVVESLDQVLKASLRAKELVRQILTFSRHEEFQRTPLRLDDVLAETVGLLRVTVPDSIRLSVSVKPPVPVIDANVTLIQQVLINLVTNAAQAIGRRTGRIEITVANRPNRNSAQERSAWIRVQDDGPGIEPAVLHRIFEPFFTTKGPGEGTGLGLSVVHGIVQAHGGSIRVDSEPGRGTTFEVELPAINGPDQDSHPAPTAIAPASAMP